MIIEKSRSYHMSEPKKLSKLMPKTQNIKEPEKASKIRKSWANSCHIFHSTSRYVGSASGWVPFFWLAQHGIRRWDWLIIWTLIKTISLIKNEKYQKSFHLFSEMKNFAVKFGKSSTFVEHDLISTLLDFKHPESRISRCFWKFASQNYNFEFIQHSQHA